MKKLLTTILLALLSINVFSQAPDWAWGRGAGGAYSDNAVAIATDVFGNALVTGWFYSDTLTFGSTSLAHIGGWSSDMFIVKYDSTGNVLWAKSGAGTDNDRGFGVATDAIGNVFVTGFFNSHTISFGSTTLTNRNIIDTSDIFLVKYDPNGNFLWAKKAGGIYNDRGQGVTVDASGNPIITGYFASPSITFGTTILTHTGCDTSIFIAKYDTYGNVLWAKSVNGNHSDISYGVSTDANNDIFIAGNFKSDTLTFGTTQLFNSNIFVAKYDSLGNVIWAKCSIGKSCNVRNIATDANGNTCIAGQITDTVMFGTITLNNSSAWNLLIVKYDTNGNPLWAKSNGSGSAGGGSIAWGVSIDNSNNVYITGGFYGNPFSFGTNTLTNPFPGSEQAYLAKYDASGNDVWAKGMTGGVGAEGFSVSNDLFDNTYITGWNNSLNLNFGTFLIHTIGGTDVFVAKIGNNAPAAISEFSNVNYITISPNPTTGELRITNYELKKYIYTTS